MADNCKKILVTGAAGLIGRELYTYLKSQGHDVTGIDNFTRFPNYQSDILRGDIRESLPYLEFDYIYHFAAINGTTSFYSNPTQVLVNNTQLDLAVFEHIKNYPNTKLIYASSSEVVADTDQIPTPEITDIQVNNIHNARWSYRYPKILSENYLSNSDINYVILRFFNLFSENSGSGHFVRDIINKITTDNFDLIGSDETRSFCHVSDAIPAIVTLAETQSREIFNVGSDEEINIKDAADLIAKKYSIKPKWKNVNSLEGSVKRRCPDLTKLRNIIPNYNPRSFKEVINVWPT